MTVHYISDRLMLLLSLLVASLTLAHPVAAQGPVCDTPLLQRTISVTTEDSRFRAAWLNLVTESNYDDLKRNASGSAFSNFFSGSYDEFQSKRRDYLSRNEHSVDASDSRQEVRVELPKDAVPAWRDCVLRESSDFFYWLDAVDKNGATLGLGWKPAPGNGELRHITVDLRGGRSRSLNKLHNLPQGKKTFAIERGSPTGAVRGTVSGEAGENKATFSVAFYVPALPTSQPFSFQTYLRQGQPVTLKLDHLSTCIGTILPDGVYTVSYSYQRHGWLVDGDHGDGTCPPKTRERTSSDTYTCANVPSVCGDTPEAHRLVIFGHTFTFDNNGRVFDDGHLVGTMFHPRR